MGIYNFHGLIVKTATVLVIPGTGVVAVHHGSGGVNVHQREEAWHSDVGVSDVIDGLEVHYFTIPSVDGDGKRRTINAEEVAEALAGQVADDLAELDDEGGNR